ncbi:AmiS/UreI family transporter [Mycolicibacterium goodii]|uniref:AmiS/UreI family transporter n=1 Tax=Mycolicibacterium goodii TaxID=134601 RepID=A0ABS6HMB1_MYCGD|nr:AmiS/UreI family transporter [Mycolicibacterium goodii]OKH66993.1 transporter [Mycobacterium sp. SWH-M5]MBU8812567.1 AmiS/UreI family transporter [Mycolicibacterium goodii]MBU8818830.1 AmiS/UreI family transporter [Mycolicibacterium goodii]MBU8823466.1 AmiS/UreI family transporter [Mycolicibacterium goodii]MBU8835485.1 AmiS/UreI family transporter [Mycolicibacterium goodii]
MGGVGLFYVGAVLIIDGLMLLGRISPRGATPLNFFVGTLQVVTPTVLILQSGGDADVIFAASGLYLFGFTYLWVAINNVTDWGGEGLGWFSLFVAIAALGYSWHAFTVEADPAFGVIWLLWAVLWFLFFLLLGLRRDALGPAVGFVAVVDGVLTAAIPAFLIVSGNWQTGPLAAAVIAVIGFAAVILAFPIGRRLAAPPETTATPAATAAGK